MVELEFTGERMVPGRTSPETFWEHIYRYRLALGYAPGRRILDIACGEGYGAAALLHSGAASVIGIDNSVEACEHAVRKYGIDARVGDAEAIPLEDASVDLVVSFETIEHLPHPATFLAECARVLVPDGTLIVSTPNRDVYSAIDGVNPFHCSELTEEELVSALSAEFTDLSLWHQHPVFAASPCVHLLAADNSPWHGTPGFRSLRKLLRRLCCRHIKTEPCVNDALSLLEIVRRRDPAWSPIANPCALFQPTSKTVIPKYIVAVAKKKGENV